MFRHGAAQDDAFMFHVHDAPRCTKKIYRQEEREETEARRMQVRRACLLRGANGRQTRRGAYKTLQSWG